MAVRHIKVDKNYNYIDIFILKDSFKFHSYS